MTDANMRGAPQPEGTGVAIVRVWDPLVRVFHWGLVAAFATAWLTADEIQPVHEVAGYTVAGLVAFRLVWGLVGSRHARFARFVKGPGETLAYLGDTIRGTERRYLGHNPAGAAMILALLVTLSGTAFTGWLMEEPERLAMLPEMPAVVSAAWADDEAKEYGEGREVEGPAEGRPRDSREPHAPTRGPACGRRGAGILPPSREPRPRDGHRRQARPRSRRHRLTPRNPQADTSRRPPLAPPIPPAGPFSS